jgi:hypothetical protein
MSRARAPLSASVVVVGLAVGVFLSNATETPPPAAGAREHVEDEPTIIDAKTELEAIRDLRKTLEGYTAGRIVIERVPLETRTGQAFYLEVAPSRVLIRYTTEHSLENAVYTLLDDWGFRWYGPGENWFVHPERIVKRDVPGKWYAPTFRNRGTFGTGGLDFAQPPAFDPENQYKADSTRWKRRLRLNSDFQPPGHAGAAFYGENRELLDAHPEWFNSDKGKEAGRIRVEIPEAVEAYKDWIGRKYDAQVGQGFVAIGTDPEDGRGGEDDPLPPASMGLKNHADKWWYLTNEVARMYPEDDPRTVVSAYAYINATVPSFRLRKNVYPYVIPYAFQTDYEPHEMIRKWAEQSDGTMGIYDYWNITQWSHGLPQFDMYQMEEKLDYWQRHKIDGVLLESTDAAGPMGHALWIASQLMFDGDSDFETLYARYLTDCFGEAAPPMRRMYDRWSLRNQGSGEVAQSLNDLHEASQLVPRRSPPWKRINELKAYVHYMRLYHEHDGTQASKDRLFEYLYGIHHLMMVQTSAFKHQHYISPLDKGNITPEGTARRLTPDEIERNFREDLAAYPLQYEVLTIDFDPAKARWREPAPQTSWRFGGTPHYRLTPKESGTIEFSAGAIGSSEFTFYTRDEILIKETVGETNHSFSESIEDKEWKMKRYSIDVKAGKTYQIRLRHGFNRFVTESPLPLFSSQGYEDFDNYAYPDKYFYVPKNATQVVFSDPHPEGLNGKGYLIDPDGNVHKRTPIGAPGLFTVPVEPRHRGRVWTARFGHPSWSLRNVPNVVSIMPFDYDE